MGLIRIYLAFQDLESGKEAVRDFQSIQFGSQKGGFSLLELFPLPSPSTDEWIYAGVTEIPYLLNRSIYKYYLYPKRSEELRRRILLHEPRIVVVCGKDYLEEWEGITRAAFQDVALDDAKESLLGKTRILLIPHPVSYGRSQKYWVSVGNYLRKTTIEIE